MTSTATVLKVTRDEGNFLSPRGPVLHHRIENCVYMSIKVSNHFIIAARTKQAGSMPAYNLQHFSRLISYSSVVVHGLIPAAHRVSIDAQLP